MNPPPIGEALEVGWNTFKQNPVPILIGFICACLLTAIPLGGGLAFAGMMQVSLKALRGQTPEVGDAFVGFQAFVDHFIMGILQILGVIACCVGVYVTQGIFYPGTLLMLDKGMTWQQAKDACMERIKPNWVSWTIFVLVMGLVGGLGSILCVVGVFVTAPVAVIGMAYAYERTLGGAAQQA
jgi:hypothetical protein